MSFRRLERISTRLWCTTAIPRCSPQQSRLPYQIRAFSRTPCQRNRSSRPGSNARNQVPVGSQRQAPTQQQQQQPGEIFPGDDPRFPAPESRVYEAFREFQSTARVRYLRPAVWAVVVSGGIFTGLAFLQAKEELKPQKKSGWLEVPQWTLRTGGPPSPTEVASKWWETQNPISKLSYELIGANVAVHLSGMVLPKVWDKLWHTPVRNINYTQFTSMFVHSGFFHLFVNMYFTYNFMIPVGYSKTFEGNSNHVLAFFLSTGVLSGFAQHWSTLITPQKRAIPEIFIRCGGASGALLGMLGVFCTQYPNAGLGIMFVPVHFDAQYVLPAIMLFDLVGMVRGYTFVNLGHAAHLSGAAIGVAYSYFDGKDKIWRPLVQFWKGRLQSS